MNILLCLNNNSLKYNNIIVMVLNKILIIIKNINTKQYIIINYI